MMEWIEISAVSVENAKEQALAHLGVHDSDAEFEVLSEGKIGLFGRVKEAARVRARVIPTPVRPKESRSRGAGSGRRTGSGRKADSRGNSTEASGESKGRRSRRGSDRRQGQSSSAREPAPSPKSAPSPESAPSPKSQVPRRGGTAQREDSTVVMQSKQDGPSLSEQADLAEAFVRGVADSVGVELRFVRHDIDNGILRIEAHGDGVGLLVGRRGATAQAIDELVRTVLQRSGGTTREGKIRIDIGGFRARRAAALAEFTRQVAAEAIETESEIALEPMSRMDRKIVHDVVAELEDVSSRSEGEDPNRRVIIAVESD